MNFPISAPAIGLDPKRTTIHTQSPTGLNLIGRRNRAKNRGKVEKTRRNQKGVALLRSAYRRQQWAETPADQVLPDIRVDIGDRDTYASSKAMFRGLKKALRQQNWEKRIADLAEDQRKRYEARAAAITAALTGPLDTRGARFTAYCDAHRVYNRQTPVKPYAPIGVRSNFYKATP